MPVRRTTNRCKVIMGRPWPRPVPAERRDFWSFRPLIRSPLPAVSHADWCRNPIDHFVLAKLEARGMQPSGPAERRRLIRRASFDLLGLPPTVEQVEEFVADTNAAAYERLVDRLLASPDYGERWGRHWLDLARFAESHGYEQDYDRPNAYHYRDFVIRALNDDMPYDQFVRWQIAGDELATGQPQAWMATGFLAAGTHATQITANQAEKERYDELDDMAATIGTAMLGLTIGCARCHDHKFDPISQHDYYRMLANFTTTVRSDYDFDLNPEATRIAKQAFDAEHAPLAAELQKFESAALPGRFNDWLASRPQLPSPEWLILDFDATKSTGRREIRPSKGRLVPGQRKHRQIRYLHVYDAPGAASHGRDSPASPGRPVIAQDGAGACRKRQLCPDRFSRHGNGPWRPAAPD